MNKIYKAITFTAIISLPLATASSSVKAATFIVNNTFDRGSISLQESILEDITITDITFYPNQIETVGSGIGNVGILTINSSNLTHNIVTRDQGQGGSISIAEEAIVTNSTFNNNLVLGSTAGGNITISSGSLSINSGSLSINSGGISNAGEAIVTNSTFNNNLVPPSTAGGSITISTSSIIRVTTIPEPASPISFAILGLGGLLLRFNKFREKKPV
jgi:hypothetical protein